jgi:hypothetical protein
LISNTALHEIVKAKDVEMASFLMENGADGRLKNVVL